MNLCFVVFEHDPDHCQQVRSSLSRVLHLVSMSHSVSAPEPVGRFQTEEGKRGINLPLRSQVGIGGKLPVYIYCPRTAYTEIHSRHTSLDSFCYGIKQ